MVTQSDSIAKLAAALVKANAEVQHAIKDSKNPHYRSDYASLASVLDTIKPVYAAHGLAIMQMPGFGEGHATLDSMIVHESGEWVRSTAGAPLPKQDPQGVGSALTYLRRYSLAAIAGIHQEDDDGNAAARAKPPTAAVIKLIEDVQNRLELVNGSVKKEVKTAAQQAIAQQDEARLRAALQYLDDLNKVEVTE